MVYPPPQSPINLDDLDDRNPGLRLNRTAHGTDQGFRHLAQVPDHDCPVLGAGKSIPEVTVVFPTDFFTSVQQWKPIDDLDLPCHEILGAVGKPLLTGAGVCP